MRTYKKTILAAAFAAAAFGIGGLAPATADAAALPLSGVALEIDRDGISLEMRDHCPPPRYHHGPPPKHHHKYHYHKHCRR